MALAVALMALAMMALGDRLGVALTALGGRLGVALMPLALALAVLGAYIAACASASGWRRCRDPLQPAGKVGHLAGELCPITEQGLEVDRSPVRTLQPSVEFQ